MPSSPRTQSPGKWAPSHKHVAEPIPRCGFGGRLCRDAVVSVPRSRDRRGLWPGRPWASVGAAEEARTRSLRWWRRQEAACVTTGCGRTWGDSSPGTTEPSGSGPSLAATPPGQPWACTRGGGLCVSAEEGGGRRCGGTLGWALGEPRGGRLWLPRQASGPSWSLSPVSASSDTAAASWGQRRKPGQKGAANPRRAWGSGVLPVRGRTAAWGVLHPGSPDPP